MEPFNIHKQVDPELESIRDEFKPKGIAISEIDGEYRIFRKLHKGPRKCVFVGSTHSLKELWRRCYNLILE